MKRFVGGLIVGVSLAGGLSAQAQLNPDDSSWKALRGARSLKCAFPWFASADWEKDQPQLKSATQQELDFQIDGIDYRNSKARIIGNAWAEDLLVFQGTDSTSFIEQTPVGAVNLTTVFAWRDKSGRFKAVHSRHTAIGGPSPSQNYGHCQVWE
jgi:hypothetical protein